MKPRISPLALAVTLLLAWTVLQIEPRSLRARGGDGVGATAPCGDLNQDGIVDLSDAVHLLSFLFIGGPPPSCPGEGPPPGPAAGGLPATGQSQCWGLTGSPVECGGPGCVGQDGAYVAGCPLEDRFVDNGDGTVTDLCTGLMWQADAADVDGDGWVSDADRPGWCDSLAFCESLEFAGHDDWRLPNVRELQSIVDYGRETPSLPPALYGPASGYWSSTSVTADPSQAWFVSFFHGNVMNGGKGFPGYVRAVRTADAPSGL